MMLNSKFSNKTNTSVRDKKILPIKLFVSIIINQTVSPPPGKYLWQEPFMSS